jgi:DNA-binding protein
MWCAAKMSKKKETKKSVKKDKPKTETKPKKEEEKPKTVKTVETKKREENVVYVGRKPTMNYVLALMTSFNQGADDVVLKARGRATSKAVDIAEVVRKKFLDQTLKVKDIQIGTDKIGEGNDVRNVSTLEITLTKD